MKICQILPPPLKKNATAENFKSRYSSILILYLSQLELSLVFLFIYFNLIRFFSCFFFLSSSNKFLFRFFNNLIDIRCRPCDKCVVNLICSILVTLFFLSPTFICFLDFHSIFASYFGQTKQKIIRSIKNCCEKKRNNKNSTELSKKTQFF